MMQIYIPTSGRADRQATYKWLPLALKRVTALVVQAREEKAYRQANPGAKILVLPRHIDTVSPTRQWIVDQHKVKAHGSKLVMVDDDLRFDVRRLDKNGLFVVATQADVTQLFVDINKLLSKFAHVGVLAREGGNRVPEAFRTVTRMVRVLAYDVNVVRKTKSIFRLACRQDFDMTLQLLRKGYPNYVICDRVQGQGGSQHRGGCSAYRTLKMLETTAKDLQKLHPAFVSLVQKETRSAWGGTREAPVERTEVQIQWKKAFASSGRAGELRLKGALK